MALRGQVDLIYDVFRTLLLNKLYYGERLVQYTRYNLIMELLIAFGAAGSGVAGLAVFATDTGRLLWGIIAAASIMLATAKPFLKLPDRIQTYAKLSGEYTSAYQKMKILVEDMQIDKTVSPERIKLFNELRSRSVEFAELEDTAPDHTVILRLQDAVNQQIRIELLWTPNE